MMEREQHLAMHSRLNDTRILTSPVHNQTLPEQAIELGLLGLLQMSK